MRDRTAITRTTAGLIMVLAVAIVLLLAVDLWAGILKQGVDIESCRRSIATSTAAKEYTAGFIHPEYNCPVELDIIEEKDNLKIMHKIANNHLKGCWYKTGGQDSQIGIKRAGEKFIDEDTCFVCSEFTVNQEISTQDLADYLKNKALGTDISYLKYLSTDWNSEDNSHYFVQAPSRGVLEKLEKIKAFSEESPKLDNYYLVVFTFYNDKLDDIYDKKGLPQGWEYSSSGVGNKIKIRHIFIIPKEQWSNLVCKKIYQPKV